MKERDTEKPNDLVSTDVFLRQDCNTPSRYALPALPVAAQMILGLIWGILLTQVMNLQCPEQFAYAETWLPVRSVKLNSIIFFLIKWKKYFS